MTVEGKNGWLVYHNDNSGHEQDGMVLVNDISAIYHDAGQSSTQVHISGGGSYVVEGDFEDVREILFLQRDPSRMLETMQDVVADQAKRIRELEEELNAYRNTPRNIHGEK